MSGLRSSFAHHAFVNFIDWRYFNYQRSIVTKISSIFVAAVRPYTITTTNNWVISECHLRPPSACICEVGQYSSLIHIDSFVCGCRAAKRRHRGGFTQGVQDSFSQWVWNWLSLLIPSIYLVMEIFLKWRCYPVSYTHVRIGFKPSINNFTFHRRGCAFVQFESEKAINLYSRLAFGLTSRDHGLGRVTCAWEIQKPTFAREKLVTPHRRRGLAFNLSYFLKTSSSKLHILFEKTWLPFLAWTAFQNCGICFAQSTCTFAYFSQSIISI